MCAARNLKLNCRYFWNIYQKLLLFCCPAVISQASNCHKFVKIVRHSLWNYLIAFSFLFTRSTYLQFWGLLIKIWMFDVYCINGVYNGTVYMAKWGCLYNNYKYCLSKNETETDYCFSLNQDSQTKPWASQKLKK